MPGRHRVGDRVLDRVERLAGLAPLLRRQLAQGLHHLRNAPVAAERRDAHRLQRIEVVRRRNLGEKLVAQFVVTFHGSTSPASSGAGAWRVFNSR